MRFLNKISGINEELMGPADNMDKWININDSLPETHDIVKVRRENGDEINAYYHADKMCWLNYYGKKTSHFQSFKSLEFLFDVTHWKRDKE